MSKSKSIVIRLYLELMEFENRKFRNLEGRLLTLIDAMLSTPEQKKAFKDLVKSAIGEVWWGRSYVLDQDWFVLRDLAEVIGDEEYKKEISTGFAKDVAQPSHTNIFK